MRRARGARVLQIGRDPDAPWVTTRSPRQGHCEGFDLHANLAVRADDRDALARLCRYILRPPVAETRLQRLTDGRVLLTLKGEWSDGTTHVLFAPIELLEKLAALIPRPRINMLLYPGILAPHAAGRRAAVRRADARAPGSGASGALPTTTEIIVPPSPPLIDAPVLAAGIPPPEPRAPATPRYWTWATLRRLAVALDVLACPRCGGRMDLLATIEDPRIVARILGHLGLPTEASQPRPARSPPAVRDLFGDAAN